MAKKGTSQLHLPPWKWGSKHTCRWMKSFSSHFLCLPRQQDGMFPQAGGTCLPAFVLMTLIGVRVMFRGL